MKRETFDVQDFRGVQWFDSDGQLVMVAQTDKRDGKSLFHLGIPHANGALTEDETVAMVDTFAPAVAVLLSEIRAELARLRSTPPHADAGVYEVAP